MSRTGILGLLLSALVTCHLLTCRNASAQSLEEADSETIKVDAAPIADTTRIDESAVAQQIIQKTNAFRATQNHSKLEENPKLRNAAQYFAEYMAKNDVYGHHADGNRPAERVKRYEYDYCLVLENIAYQFNSAGFTEDELAERLVEGWKTSPKHRKNMLDDDATETAVAVARSDDTGYWYAVQLFGRPKSAAIQFQISNQSDTTVAYTIRDRSFELPPRYTRTHMRCRESPVDFNFAKQTGVRPSNGDRYTILREEGELKLQTQAAN